MKLRTPAALLFAGVFCNSWLPAQTPQSNQSAQIGVQAAPAVSPGTHAKRRPLSEIQAAAGGSPDQVWVNTTSKVYHCPGTAYYGKTKAGKYMTEDAAKAENDRADHGRPCTK